MGFIWFSWVLLRSLGFSWVPWVPLDSFKRLIKNGKYREGVLTQLFYVAAQIMCWTFIIQYADNLGIAKATAQNYNIVAMSIFLSSRFISTFLMKYINSKKLLTIFALCAMTTITGVIFIEGMIGLYLLIATSAFMSLMFPTIYGIALGDLTEEQSKVGSAQNPKTPREREIYSYLVFATY